MPPVDRSITNTQHGMLVAFGEFLSQHGLLARLSAVPIRQKERKYSPQAKLIEFLAGIMSGIEYLEDLSDGPRPLTRDPAVARAWGMPGLAHSSGVSRTLAVCDERTVAAVTAAIAEFSRPFIDTCVNELVRRGKPITYDLDLTGQAVSATSTTYPDVAFGWMNDQVRLGYQLARVCVSDHQGERVWLAGFHHPGDRVSVTCLQELVVAAEAQTRVRPRRRIELVEQRLDLQRQEIARLERLIGQQQAKLEHLQATQTRLIGWIYHAEQVADGAVRDAADGPVSPGKQARLRARLAGWQARLTGLPTQITRAQSVLATHHTHRQAHQTRLAELLAWRAKLEADNQANPNPPPVVIARMDAGFTSGSNLTWLLEMGYAPDTKAPNGQTTAVLRTSLSDLAVWQRVGHNAEMTLIGEYFLHGCPFPLWAALERFKVGQVFHYATLIRYAGDPSSATHSLSAWFRCYNARQTIEAGNKEMKHTFFVQHLMSHSRAGICLQVLFTGLAANTIRWCRPWLKRCVIPSTPTPQLTRAIDSPKRLVRVVANSAAEVQHTAAGTTLQFASDSAVPGAMLCLRGVPAFQLALALHRPCISRSP
jgi:hypothetical protein